MQTCLKNSIDVYKSEGCHKYIIFLADCNHQCRELRKSRIRQQVLSVLSDDIDLKSLAADIKMRQYIQIVICITALFGLGLGIYVNELCFRGYQPTPVSLILQYLTPLSDQD